MPNPIFNQNVLNQERVLNAEPMTINGAINKTFILLAVLLLSSFAVWDLYFKGYADKVAMLGVVGLVGSIITFIVIMFNRSAMQITTPIYAACEGLMIGGISAMIETKYPGIAIQAIALTFLALGSMLFLYRIGAIRCTEKFRSVIFISTLSIVGIYLIDFIGSFFGMHIPQISTSSNFGIAFSLVIVAIASLNLIIDFDFIERGAQNMLEKNYEWFGAFGLMVTLVWLYVEILRLLTKLKDR